MQLIQLKTKAHVVHVGLSQLLLLLKDITKLLLNSFFLFQNNNLLIVVKPTMDVLVDGNLKLLNILRDILLNLSQLIHITDFYIFYAKKIPQKDK